MSAQAFSFYLNLALLATILAAFGGWHWPW